MKRYCIPKQTRLDWSAVASVELEPCRWSPNPPPRVSAQAIWRETALLVRLQSRAAPTRAVNTAPDSPVWEDSCLEFFFSLDSRNYVNLEANANGALRASLGPDRHERRLLRELAVPLPRVNTAVETDAWTLELEIPAALMEALFGARLQSGLALRGNFYSCGDKTPRPHYAAWNPVETEEPDFHRPEYFGELWLV